MTNRPNLESVLDADVISHIPERPDVIGGQWVENFHLLGFNLNHDMVPGYWSPARDEWLRKFWKKSDHLAGAVYAIQTRLSSVPTHIVAKNPHIALHTQVADQLKFTLDVHSQEGKGWEIAYTRFIEDVLTQDNGGFMRISGDGQPWEPIRGLPNGVVHMDSQLCERTNHPLFPVIYHDPQTGDNYPLYWTRVIDLPLQSSPDATYMGVGFSAVSRAINVATRLMDIAYYFQEKMGSRPIRGILQANGIDRDRLAKALAAAAIQNDNEARGYFSKLIALASVDAQLDIKLVDLTRLVEGFDEESVTRLTMYTIALAFGVDSREIWTAVEEGATKGDAYITHLKARGKTIGYVMRYVEQQMALKFVPSYLDFYFDSQDDALDDLETEQRKRLSESLASDTKARIISDRTARQIMLRKGYITDADFEYEELQAGRLPDGAPVLSLFFSNDPDIRSMLSLGISDPLDIDGNNATEVLQRITRQEKRIQTALINTVVIAKRNKAQQALAALRALRVYYNSPATPLQPPSEPLVLPVPESMMPPEEEENGSNTDAGI